MLDIRVRRLSVFFALLFSVQVTLPDLFSQDTESGSPPEASAPIMKAVKPDQLPEVVARVNNEPISRIELISRAESVRAQAGIPEGDLPLEIYKTVLEELVSFELLYQSSRARNAGVSSEQVDQEFQAIRSQYPSEAEFREQLTDSGLTPEALKELMLKDMSVQKFVQNELAPKVIVTDEEKKAFYEEQKSLMKTEEQLKIRHILIEASEDSGEQGRQVAREKAEGLRTEIVESGADFAALAREHSDDPGSKDQGGEMTIQKGQTVEPFENAAYALNAGEVSPVIETQFGYHIIQLSERIPAREVPYTEAEASINQFLRQQHLQDVVGSEVKMLREQATIELFL